MHFHLVLVTASMHCKIICQCLANECYFILGGGKLHNDLLVTIKLLLLITCRYQTIAMYVSTIAYDDHNYLFHSQYNNSGYNNDLM